MLPESPNSASSSQASAQAVRYALLGRVPPPGYDRKLDPWLELTTLCRAQMLIVATFLEGYFSYGVSRCMSPARA